MVLLSDATTAYMGTTPVTAMYKGATQVWPPVTALPRHSIWAPSPFPGTIDTYSDGFPSIKLGQCFYRTGASTNGWKVIGGRLYVPDAGLVPATVTISLLTHPYESSGTFNINAAPVRLATVSVVSGWNTATWTPYVIDVGTVENAWIVYTFDSPHYIFSSGVRPTNDPRQASDGSTIWWSEGNFTTQHGGAYSMGGGATHLTAEPRNGYGVDIVMEEAA